MRKIISVACFVALAAVTLSNAPVIARDQGEDPYTYGAASRDGIGKFYFGREISHVMGHLGAGWLERSGREAEERTDLLLQLLPIESGSVVADIGAGTGYFSLPMAKIATDGKVFAIDIQPEMLAIVSERAARNDVSNIVPVLATETDPRLPSSEIDLALIVDAYHEFEFPREVMAGIKAGLKGGGLLYLVEYRAEDPRVPIKRLHKMSQAQAIREVEAAGLKWLMTLADLPQQHVLVFEKPATAESDE